MRPIVIFLSVVLLGGCVTPGSDNVVVKGEKFRLVTGEQLRTVFVGQKIRYPDPYRYGPQITSSVPKCDGFYPDGRYLSCGDRVPVVHGTYRVLRDSVCVNAW